MNKKLLISIAMIFVVIFVIWLLAFRSEQPIDRKLNESNINSPPSVVIEIEDDGDVNVNGVEIFDPEDVAKAAAAVLVTRKVAVNKDAVTKEIKASTKVGDTKVSKRVTTTTTPTTYKKVTKTKVTPIKPAVKKSTTIKK